MNETGKSHYARHRNDDYRWLRGEVLDVGCGPWPITLPPPSNVTPWDLPQGDAQYLEGVKPESYDVVFASHVLEHMVDVPTALASWSRATKEGGYVCILVPDWHFYERMQWPSPYNPDHKASFSLVDLGCRPTDHPFYGFREMRQVGLSCGLTLMDARLELDNYDIRDVYNKKRDQTMGNALAQCCFIYLKA